jgi:DNA-binding transcriptional regulator YhcF (GntR family)
MEIDRIPITQLPSRYGIARSNLYTRLKDLGIEPEKMGKKAFVNAEQLQLLDALHEHIQKGGTTGEFLKSLNGATSDRALVTSPNEQNPLFQPNTLVAVVEAIVKRLLPNTGSRLSYLRELEEAYEKGWLLSTSEVADLLGLSPKTIAAYGQEFFDAGFVFTRAGTRKGGEIAWAIDKESSFGALPPQSAIGIKEAFSDDFDPEPE